ncbi:MULTISPECIES: DUF4876 domain-containing protein [Flavobacterium]|uniref:DUF4876 domain-containing protein n=1 Tax=Flavobacterium TaxID=237 RepID=UPI0009660711|nr:MULTISPECIES: DUF4876 domain-containing protein [Flavobacterium]MBN9285435.1 DUF4876 domain-containing protein [Flavobacterium sp.]OJV71427.1 MAG: hypothetical protein BGO42_06115 [Flavobacterium sp. 40-81]
MKKILLLLSAALAFSSCSDDDFGDGNNGLQPVNFSVNLKYDTTAFNGEAVQQGAVILTNTNTGDTYTVQSNTSGVATFNAIIPGTYNITATKTLTSAEFNTQFGYTPETPSVLFNGAQEQVIVNANVSGTELKLKTIRIGDLVIKQIYYAGSHAQQGAVFRDQFIEIYNNSNEKIYADGLCIGQLYGKTSTTSASYTLSNGQFDWSKSIGMTSGSAANTDYVYADYVIKVPGNGTEYPILPGESIVIAQTGINHKAPLVDNSNEPLTVQNPDLTVDLSNAEFEVYLGDYRLSLGEEVYRYDIQNPAVKDMNIAYWGRQGYSSPNKDFLMDNLGRDSFVIFREENLNAYPNFSDPSVTNIINTTKFFIQIPKVKIIDGVELQHYNPSSQRPKMLQAEVDASFINCDAAYNSQAVIRKTKTIVNGRKILEDTNNSSNDFIKQKANPKGFAN